MHTNLKHADFTNAINYTIDIHFNTITQASNPRAKHVYMKAGFEHIADFMMPGTVSGAGKQHHLLIKRMG